MDSATPSSGSSSPRQAVLDLLDSETRQTIIEATGTRYTEDEDVWIIVLMVMAAVEHRNDRAVSAIQDAVDRLAVDEKKLDAAQSGVRADLANMDARMSETFATLRQSLAAELHNERRNVDSFVQKAVYSSIEHHVSRAIPKVMDRYTSILTSVNLGKSIAVIGGALVIGFFTGAVSILAIAGLGAGGWL